MAQKIQTHRFVAAFGQAETDYPLICQCGASMYSEIHNVEKKTKIKGIARPTKIG